MSTRLEKAAQLKRLKEEKLKKAEARRAARLLKRQQKGEIIKEDDPLLQKNRASPSKPKVEIKLGDGREFAEFVGTFSLAPKQKVMTASQGVNVTKADIDLIRMLQEEEEEAPQLDYKVFSEDSEDEFAENGDEEKNNVRYLKEEIAEKVMESTTFQRFIRKGSIDLEDALNNSFSLLEDMLENENPDIAPNMREKLRMTKTIKSEAILKNYTCVGLEWCRLQAHLFLAVYNSKDKNTEYVGKVLIWDTTSNLREPIHTLLSQKKITRASFDSSNEHFIYAALATGQILAWDLRENSQESNNYSKASLDTHVLPVFCFEQVTDGRRNMLLSLGYGGNICLWNKDRLFEVEKTQKLEIISTEEKKEGKPTETKTRPIAPIVSCLSDHTNTAGYSMYLGTHDFGIRRILLEDLMLGEEPAELGTLIKVHTAPVCSLSLKRNLDNPQIDNMLLSGSFDFSIALTIPTRSENLILRLNVHEDYVTCLEWNPEHPAMFVSADCSGKVCLWNLLEDKDYPVYISKSEPVSSLKWHPDGLRLIVGNLAGEVQIWKIKKKWLVVVEEQLEEFERLFDHI